MMFHWQNLTDDKRRDRTKAWPYHGRCWLHVGNRRVWRFCWDLASRFCGVSVKASAEDGMILFAAFPPVAFWLTVPIRAHRWFETPFWAKWNERLGGYPGSHRYTTFEVLDLRVHDWALWWTCLKFGWGWSSKMPKWMSGSWHILDTLLGRTAYTKKDLRTVDALIPMPEGSYPAVIKFEECTWKRPRLPWVSKRGTFATVDIACGIPHEGKGENSWDCGEDGLFGLSREVSTVEQAIAATVECVLKDRRRYNGNINAKYPPPEERIKRIAEQRAKAASEPQPVPGASS